MFKARPASASGSHNAWVVKACVILTRLFWGPQASALRRSPPSHLIWVKPHSPYGFSTANFIVDFRILALSDRSKPSTTVRVAVTDPGAFESEPCRESPYSNVHRTCTGLLPCWGLCKSLIFTDWPFPTLMRSHAHR